jgi:two-component system, cell cycle response regulator DivK
MTHRTILVIDETPDHRDILCRLLRAVGYRVVEAGPGAEAIDRARREQPDLILMALSLPGQPAWETARLLHDQPALAHTPILGATVYNTLLSRARVRAIGCTDYVDKPFDVDDLLRRIGQLLPSSPRPAIAA